MQDYEFFIALGLILVFIIGASIYRKYRLIKNIKAAWGRLPSGEFIASDLEDYLSKSFKQLSAFKGASHLVDDISWNDLDMMKVFNKINTCNSSLGAEVLYYKLRNLDMEDREDFIKLKEIFSNDSEKRVKTQYQFSRLGKMNDNKVVELLLSNRNIKKHELVLYVILGLIPLLSIILIIANQLQIGISILFVSLPVNLIFTVVKKKDLDSDFNTVSYLIQAISVANRLSKMGLHNSEKIKKLLKNIDKLKHLSISNQVNFSNELEMFAYYFNTVFMLPFIFHSFALKIINRNKETLLELWLELGLVEAAIAGLNYEITLDKYCVPGFINDHEIRAEGIHHPLIENPVPNPVDFNKLTLVSGSNASGKSTYVKSIALNAIFAQSLYIALADSFALKPGRVFTSMAIRDNVVDGDSYFIAEIKSLKRIVEDSKQNDYSYYFIDEILRGTNTLERIAASASIIKYFLKRNVLAMIATHDLELTELFAANLRNIHFREELLENKQIHFTYKLQEGPSNTKNAIKLLDSLEFPQEIIEGANDMIQNLN